MSARLAGGNHMPSEQIDRGENLHGANRVRVHEAENLIAPGTLVAAQQLDAPQWVTHDHGARFVEAIRGGAVHVERTECARVLVRGKTAVALPLGERQDESDAPAKIPEHRCLGIFAGFGIGIGAVDGREGCWVGVHEGPSGSERSAPRGKAESAAPIRREDRRW